MMKIHWKQVAARQNEGRRAIGIGSHVEHVERVADQFRSGVGFWLDCLAEHGIRIIYPIGMGYQRKARKAIAWNVVLMHISLHNKRSLCSGSHPLYGFE